jgi:UDP-N-acetylglucosamine diphosphorylase/glucosamine-1-phosphate N-acetyltransferase
MKAIILAAGKGVRMKSDLPKVVHKLHDKPLVNYVVDSLQRANVNEIIAVVGYKSEIVKKVIGDNAIYVLQKEQLGTGHAVLQAEKELQNYSGPVIVACGDAPFIKSQSFMKLFEIYNSDENVKGVVLTVRLENPSGYGRIVKKNDEVLEIVEEKDASENIKKITEVNSGTYLFDSKILFDGLKTIDTNNAQNEYYLPDIVKYVNKLGYKFNSFCLEDPREGMGINTKEELEKFSEITSVP